METLKNLSKQALIGALVLLIVFIMWPAATILIAIGVVIGIILGNAVPAIEAKAEEFLAKRGR